MGRLVLVDHEIVVITVEQQPIVIQRSNIEELIQDSIAKWSESTDEIKLFKRIPGMGGYHIYLCSSGSEFFKNNAKEYEALELNLLHRIVDQIREQTSLLNLVIEQNDGLNKTIMRLLNLSELHNKRVGFKVTFGSDRKFILFNNQNFFRRFFNTQSIDFFLNAFRISEIKKITSDDGINFYFELSTILEQTTYALGYPNSSTKEHVSFNISIERLENFWAKKSTIITLLILAIGGASYFYRSMNVYNDHREWTEYLTTSCEKTFSGSIKTALYSDRNFWVHADVSMDQWASDWKAASRNCFAIDTSTPEGQQERIACIAFYQEKWDWFNRCKPVVKRSCYAAGGHC